MELHGKKSEETGMTWPKHKRPRIRKVGRRLSHGAKLSLVTARLEFVTATMRIDTFTGGIFDTNCFYLPEARLLIDAPQDAADWLAGRGARVEKLVLTHGHIDHVWDAARIQKEHACGVLYHPETAPMVLRRDFYHDFGFGWEIEPIQPGEEIVASESIAIQGIDFRVLEVPGHCPGSLCLFWKSARVLFGGDVLFAGGVGRWDLPGGDRDLLLEGICGKLFPLGDDVTVLPGHGPATRIGIERQSNPYVVSR
jgi:glyoxylase-like metal-dependent hydrolase (beta-lactamase superfamily II)